MSNPVDTKTISKLAEILDKSNLTELEYEDEGCRICLTRDFGHSSAPVYQAPISTPVVFTPPAPVVSETPAVEVDLSKNPGCIKSPMVGVVYLSADPNSPNYVKVGDIVKEGDIVCLIEAMKTFNPVKAHRSGKVSQILVESGDPVEYGEPLVVIE